MTAEIGLSLRDPWEWVLAPGRRIPKILVCELQLKDQTLQSIYMDANKT